MSEQEAEAGQVKLDPKPWELTNGWRSSVQAYHPFLGWSQFSPRPGYSQNPDDYAVGQAGAT